MIEPELIPLVAQRFKVLGEPARLTLLAALQQGERSVSELVELTGRGQPNVSQHLSSLTHAGIVEVEKRGAQVYYRLRVQCVLNFFECVESVLKCNAKDQQRMLVP